MAAEGTQFESIIAHLDDIADLLTCDGIGVWVNDRATLEGPDPQRSSSSPELIAHLQTSGH